MINIGLIIIILLTLIHNLTNDARDMEYSLSTVISTRVLSIRQAIIAVSVLNLIGALLSHKVAGTISNGLIGFRIKTYVVIAALLASIIWDRIANYYDIPSNSTHTLIGGITGSAIAYGKSFQIIIWSEMLKKVIIPLLISPIIGFLIGYLLMVLLYFLLRPFSSLFINTWFKKLQIFSTCWLAVSHGKNDAQKSMGVITLALISLGLLPQGANVPLWVMILCALFIAVGTSIGGFRTVKKLGILMVRLYPINGFAAETSAAVIIDTASSFGIPLSTNKVITTSILGVGAAKRVTSINWPIAKNIIWSWFASIPTALIGVIVTLIFSKIF